MKGCGKKIDGGYCWSKKCEECQKKFDDDNCTKDDEVKE